jgi:hypothetical protein
MTLCQKIEPELKRVIDFRIEDGASERHPLVFDKKTFFPLISGSAIYTDGEKIYLPTQFKLALTDSDNEIMIASTVRHESDHIKEFIKLNQELHPDKEYDPKSINRFLEDFFLKEKFKENPTLAHEIFNIVEDNRIDRKAREELPGLARFSKEKEKPIYLNRRPSPKYLMKKKKGLSAFREFFLQKTLLDETIDEVPPQYNNLLNECVSIARSAENKDIHASLEATEKIYVKFKENFDIKQPMSQLPPFAGRGHSRMSPGLPKKYKGSIKPREGREEDKKRRSAQDRKEKKTSSEKEEQQKKISPKKKAKKNQPEESIPGEHKEREPNFKKEKESEKQDRKERGKKQKEKQKIESTSEKDKLSYWIGRGYFRKIVPKPSPGVNIAIPQGSHSDIERAHETIEKYDGEIREEINIGEYVQAELEYEATGVRPNKKMFRKRARIKKKAAWAILADISSSTAFGFGYRIIDYIKDALLIQGEALNYSGYPFGIFAFHSGGILFREIMNYKDTVYTIKDFKENYGEENRGRIMSLSPYGGTLMVNAIKYISDNLKKVEGIPKGFSIITDGEPDTPEDVRESLKGLQEDGILPFLFVIGAEHEKCAKFLIDDYVIIKRDRLAELPNEVLRIFTTYGIMK